MAKRGKDGKGKGGQDEPNPDRAAEIAQRSLMIESWKARDEIYENLFGKYTTVTPENYGPPAKLSSSSKKKKASGNIWLDSADPGDPNAESQHLAILG